IPGNYVLGVGDELIITFAGVDAETYTSAIDAEGRLIVSDLPPIRAAGQSFSQFEQILTSMVAKRKVGADVYVALGRLRMISVLVAGEVNVSGTYTFTNLSGPLEALSAAGGIKKSGSIRNILITSAGKIRTLDLYKLQTEGLGSNIYLEDGDKIVVPTVGETVAVVGNVIRKGIYELAPGASAANVADVLKFAGGSIRPRGNRISRQTFDDAGREHLIAALSVKDHVMGGDILHVRAPSNFVAGTVTLSGHVTSPGTRSLDQNTSLRALLEGREILGESPYLPFAILETTHKSTQARILKAVSLEKILSQAEDVQLKDKDSLYVLGGHEVDFLTSPELRNVLVNEVL
ncbi:MAG: hypothetical protein KAI28_02025, partial [Sphingomonadales bacterium]|nr:hypothetical protein [Sphingomonadales bacterium]